MIYLIIITCVIIDLFILVKLIKFYKWLKKKEAYEIEAFGDVNLSTCMEFGAFYMFSLNLVVVPLMGYSSYSMI